MRFLNLRGRQVKLKNSHSYIVDWDSPCRSKFQKDVKDLLRPHWLCEFVFEEFPVIGTRLKIDFYNASRRIALETDGKQHYSYSKFFHGNDRQKFIDQLKRDETKEQWCELNNIELIRITYEDKINKSFLQQIGVI